MTEKIEYNPQRERDERPRQRALLTSIYAYPTSEALATEHLDELELLCRTYGLEVLDALPLSTRSYNASTLISQGKLALLKEAALSCGADCIVIDEEISPSQQRNLEQRLGVTVLDRTEVIIEVFTQRAHSREARLQVELAKLNYMVPRLKRLWTHLSRQAGTAGGAGGYLKGAGEKQIELDRRQIRRRISRLKAELLQLRQTRQTQRKKRDKAAAPTIALIGYTNAGKSTLLNALTEADVLVEDKLFATLDTTSRQYVLGNNQEIILIDTVGFIRKLPHELIAAFKSTLDEALYADLLLHIVDASHPAALDHVDTTQQVLKELGAADKPLITLLNKADAVFDGGSLIKLRVKCPNSVTLSVIEGEGFEELEERVIQALKALRQQVKVRIPQSEYQWVTAIKRSGSVLDEEYDGNDILLQVEIPVALARQLSPYRVE